ncbi:MAG: sulfur carrier protein ThiS [Candidatus Omnitrophica bacterium]|nr:sulfur carrier protein ThiS [Candidatus Omnitrophota bacterium]
MKIMVNGDPMDLAGPVTLKALLERLQVKPELVVVEHNEKILKREQLERTLVGENDNIEIVHFVGGGI